jgi:hypothetical protein
VKLGNLSVAKKMKRKKISGVSLGEMAAAKRGAMALENQQNLRRNESIEESGVKMKWRESCLKNETLIL